MKNIHILPTVKPSRLRYFGGKLERIYAIPKKSDIIFQNIYITSEEEIKDCYVLTDLDKIVKVDKSNQELYHLFNCEKIILTTDQDLIKDGVQEIDNEFLEWFVKNPSCEEVVINKTINPSISVKEPYYSYKIIIPKEEPKQLFTEDFGLPQFGTKEFNDLASQCFGGKPKQETLEQDAELEKLAMDKLKSKWEHLYTFGYPQKPFPTNYENDLNNVKVGLYEGAKCQQERMYSEEEVLQLLLRLQQTEFYDNLYDWFEKYKKK